jgi:hypothetical protein
VCVCVCVCVCMCVSVNVPLFMCDTAVFVLTRMGLCCVPLWLWLWLWLRLNGKVGFFPCMFVDTQDDDDSFSEYVLFAYTHTHTLLYMSACTHACLSAFLCRFLLLMWCGAMWNRMSTLRRSGSSSTVNSIASQSATEPAALAASSARAVNAAAAVLAPPVPAPVAVPEVYGTPLGPGCIQARD